MFEHWPQLIQTRNWNLTRIHKQKNDNLPKHMAAIAPTSCYSLCVQRLLFCFVWAYQSQNSTVHHNCGLEADNRICCNDMIGKESSELLRKVSTRIIVATKSVDIDLDVIKDIRSITLFGELFLLVKWMKNIDRRDIVQELEFFLFLRKLWQ